MLQISIRFKFLAFSILVFLVLCSCLQNEHFVFAQTDQSQSKLQSANNAFEQAFNAVLNAEKAGANVTGMVAQLNVAANILAQAENSYRTGDLTAVSAQADSVISIAQQVTISAQNDKQTALAAGQNNFWFIIAFTEIGAGVFVLALILIWRRLKRRYIKSLYERKPEVTIK